MGTGRHNAMLGVFPLLRERLVRTGVAVTTGSRARHPHSREWPDDGSLAYALDMLESRAVAALTLNVVIRRARYTVVTSRRPRCCVSFPRNRVATFTCCSLARARREIRPGFGVFRLAPATLEISVTISAGGLLGDSIVVTEKTGGRGNGLIERITVAVNDLVAGARRKRSGRNNCQREKQWSSTG